MSRSSSHCSPPPGFEYPAFRYHDFDKGKSQMGSSSNYASQELKESENDAAKEKETITRRSTSSSRDPRSAANIPCRFFNFGLGKDCRFSHNVKTCVDPERRSGNEILMMDQDLCHKKSTISGAGCSREGEDATAWFVDKRLKHEMESKKVQVEAKKPQENCTVEKMKLSHNDTRALKKFKNEVAESVKVFLNPSWKEGKLSKENFKAIARKATEKVIDSIKRPSDIPQTRKHIDQYLFANETKIAELVQGYLKIYKSKTRV